jgi:hypothetical protein
VQQILGRFLRSYLVAPLQFALLMIFIFPTIARSQTALQFVPTTPCRVVDTRLGTGSFAGPALIAGATRTFNLPQSGCGIPPTAVAYSLNVTAAPLPQSLRWMTIWPAGTPMPSVSTLNTTGGLIKANATITAAGTNGGISVYSTDAAQLMLDINGYFVPVGSNPSSLQFFPVTPCRIADTRRPAGPLGGPTMYQGTTRSFPVLSSSCGIPSTAQVYSLNITALPQGHGTLRYLNAWATGQSQPPTSTLNSSSGYITANAALVAAGAAGAISIYTTNSTNILIDITGYFAPPASGGSSFYVMTQCRVIDTRRSAGVFNGTLAIPVQDSTCAPPATAEAYVLNATVVPSGSLSYLTLWADGTQQPNTSTLNDNQGIVASNMAIVSNTMGSIDAYASSATNIIFDLSGYFAP